MVTLGLRGGEAFHTKVKIFCWRKSLKVASTLKPKAKFVQEVWYICSFEERQQIMRVFHVEPTSGHMGISTVCCITECFFWKGITKDVEHTMMRNCLLATRGSHTLTCNK